MCVRAVHACRQSIQNMIDDIHMHTSEKIMNQLVQMDRWIDVMHGYALIWRCCLEIPSISDCFHHQPVAFVLLRFAWGAPGWKVASWSGSGSKSHVESSTERKGIKPVRLPVFDSGLFNFEMCSKLLPYVILLDGCCMRDASAHLHTFVGSLL